MDQFISPIGWNGLFRTTLVLLAAYLLLRLSPWLIRAVTRDSARRRQLFTLVARIRVFFEPSAIVVLGVLFVLANPLTHGLIVAVAALVLWIPGRNYLSGRFLRSTARLQVGRRLSFQERSGTIQSLGAFGMQLRVDNGTRLISYYRLVKLGFTIESGTQTGVILDLFLRPVTDKDTDAAPIEPADRLFGCPYLDWSHRPEVTPSEEVTGGYEVRVLLLDDSYAPAMIELAREWGYQVSRGFRGAPSPALAVD
ncbi:MAG: hypothetical protein WBA17_16160 [Saprospiraceae bacterium]